jgi:predicted acyl esterase
MKSEEKFEAFFWEGISPTLGFAPLYPGYKPHSKVDEERGIICEYDIAVNMRDGIKIYSDIFRPEKEGKYPALIAWGPYGKHIPFNDASHAASGVAPSDMSEYCAFEAPDPVYWCPHGYVIINVDPRGAWGSEGVLTFMSEQEAEDCYDLIEWVAKQPWSNGKVGMAGVSYLAWTQWRVAALNPPHLAAISPWEGVSDFYREFAFHGGIPSNLFLWLLGKEAFCCSSSGQVEDLVRMAKEHPFSDDYWASKNADLTKITVPAFIVASWSDHGLHTRGTLEAFKKIASTDKYLLIHGRKKWQFFRQMVDLQKQFFDRYLKGVDNNEVNYWPKVRMEVRERYYFGNFRSENEWPLARTQYTKLFFNADGTITNNPPQKESSVRYDAKTGSTQFEYKFNDKTELTGYMKLKLWVQAEGSDDIDLFIAIEKYDRAGDFVRFPHTVLMYDYAPAALGWLRVSHRELDEEKSMPHQPVLKHQRELKLKPGGIVPVEIEIWPSSTLFERGEKLRLVVQGRDILTYKAFGHTETVNKGEHIVHTGGKYDSHLLVSVIPVA